MTTHCTWRSAPTRLSLSAQDVHIWRVPLKIEEQERQQLEGYLPADELERASRFVFARDRERFIVAHGVLRYLLGLYLHQPPKQFRFVKNEYGKPALAPLDNPQQLAFNISHSHDLALYAFSYKRVLGIDVEYRRVIDFAELARFSFSATEQEQLLTLPVNQQSEAFYACWTRKEAYIKARGMGLSLPLHLFDVSLRPGEPAALLASREDEREVQRWSLRDLAPEDGYAGALVVEGTGWQLSAWNWSGPQPVF